MRCRRERAERPRHDGGTPDAEEELGLRTLRDAGAAQGAIRPARQEGSHCRGDHVEEAGSPVQGACREALRFGIGSQSTRSVSTSRMRTYLSVGASVAASAMVMTTNTEAPSTKGHGPRIFAASVPGA